MILIFVVIGLFAIVALFKDHPELAALVLLLGLFVFVAT